MVTPSLAADTDDVNPPPLVTGETPYDPSAHVTTPLDLVITCL